MSSLPPAADDHDGPVVHAVATPVDTPTLILSEGDAAFDPAEETRRRRQATEKTTLRAEGAIEPGLVDHPIGTFADD